MPVKLKPLDEPEKPKTPKLKPLSEPETGGFFSGAGKVWNTIDRNISDAVRGYVQSGEPTPQFNLPETVPEKMRQGANRFAETAQKKKQVRLMPMDELPDFSGKRQAPKEMQGVDWTKVDPQLMRMTDTKAQKYGVPPEVFRQLIWKESRFNPEAVGDQGKAVGLGQIWPGTFKEVMPEGDRTNPEHNLEASAKYLSKQFHEYRREGYKGDEAWKFAGAAYNAGPGALNKAYQQAQKKYGIEKPSFSLVKPFVASGEYGEEVGGQYVPDKPKPQTMEERAEAYGEIRRETEPTWGEAAKGYGIGLGRGVIGFPKTVLDLTDAALYWFGGDEYRKSTFGEAARNMQDRFNISRDILLQHAPESFKRKLQNPSWVPNKEEIFFAMMEMVPSLPAMFGVGRGASTIAKSFGAGEKAAAGVGGATTALTFASPEVYDETRREAVGILQQMRNKDGTPKYSPEQMEQISNKAARIAVSVNALPTAYLGKIGLSPAFMKGKMPAKILKAAIKDIIPEGVQEAWEGVSGNIALKTQVDPEREIFTPDVAKEGLIGAALGPLMGGGMATLDAVTDPRQKPQPKPTARGKRVPKLKPLDDPQVPRTPPEQTPVQPMPPETLREPEGYTAPPVVGEPEGYTAPPEPDRTQKEPGPDLSDTGETTPPVAPEPPPRTEAQPTTGQQAQGTVGKRAELQTVTGKHPVKYKLVEADTLVQSHDPQTFAPTPEYPQGVQERQYHQDREAQGRVIGQAQAFVPEMVLSDTPTPADGPPITTDTGIVLGGNSRTMTIKRLDPEAYENYRAKIAENAERFGIDPETVKKMNKPVLVRELEQAPQTQEQLRALGSDLNRGFTAQLGTYEQAVSSGTRIKPETLDWIGDSMNQMGEDATLRSMMERNASEIINRLRQDGVISNQEVPALYDQKRNLLTDQGRQFLETALLGSVVNDPVLLQNMPASIRNKIARALPSLARVRSRGGEWDLTQDMIQAVEAATDATNRGLTAENYLAQTSMFDESGLSERAQKLFKVLMKDKPTQFQKRLKRYAQDAHRDVEGQTSLLEPTSPVESMQEAFASKKPKQAKGETQALSARAWQVKMPMEAQTKETVSKKEILDFVEEAFGVPVRAKITHAWNRDKAGEYHTRAEVIRMRGGRFGPVEVLSHELAHHIDKQIGKKMGTKWMQNMVPDAAYQELLTLDYDPEQQRDFEGFAEFMRHYLTTGKHQELAPNFTSWFEGQFAPNLRINDKGQIQYQNRGMTRAGAPKGYHPFSGPLGNLKNQLATWYGQGALQRMQSHIDFEGKMAKPREGAGVGDWVIEHFLDSNAMFGKVTEEYKRRTGKQNIDPQNDPRELARYAQSKQRSILRHMIKEAMIDPYGRKIGPSLVEAMEPAKIKNKQLEREFWVYVTGLRAQNLHARGIETGFDIEDVNHVVKVLKRPGWDEAAEKVTKWSDQLMDWYVWSGDLSPELKQLFRDQNPIYIPFKRVFENLNLKGSGRGLSSGKAVKKIIGSTRPIQNPTASLIEQARTVLNRAWKTKIVGSIADMAGQEGMGNLIQEVPLASHPTRIRMADVLEKLNKAGYEWAGDEEIVLADDFLEFWHRDANYRGPENVIAVWRNGEQKLYEVNQKVIDALKQLDPQWHRVVKLMAPFARLARLGWTGLNFFFTHYTNPIRDAVWYAVNSRRAGANPLGILRGLMKELRARVSKGENLLTQRAMRAGGEMATMYGHDIAMANSVYDDVIAKQRGLRGKAYYVMRHPLEFIQRFFQTFELAPRAVEFEAVYNQVRKQHPEWSEEGAFIYAFNHGWQDVTVNFTRAGSWGRNINQAVPFFNTVVQGPNKLYRSFKERPIQTLIKSLLWVTLPAILFWDKIKDDEEYKNLPPDFKYRNMWYKTDDGELIRIPGSHELFGLFGGSVMAALDEEYNKDAGAVEGAVKALLESVTPPITPQIVAPMIEKWRNRDWLDRPIEPEHMRSRFAGVPVEDRKFDHTTPLAIELSKAMNAIGFEWSPIQMDHLLKQYSGGFYSADRGFDAHSKKHPVFPRAFLRHPQKPRRQLDEFFDQMTRLRHKKNADKATPQERHTLRRMGKVYKKQIKPIMDRIRRLREEQTMESAEEINTLYGEIAKRLNYFLDPEGKGQYPYREDEAE